MSRVSYGSKQTESLSIPVSNFERVKLEEVGFIGGVRSHITAPEIVRLEKLGMQLAIAEASRGAIAPTVAGLATRNFIVDKDFEDGNDNPIQMRNWRQPWSGYYTNTSGEFEVYRTTKDSDYDKKVIVIWGLRYVDTGPGRLDSIVKTSAIIFKDSAGNTYDCWQTQGLDIHPEVYAHTPLVFGSTRQLKVFAYPKTGSSGSFDSIELLGCVAERRGDQVNGLQHPDILSST